MYHHVTPRSNMKSVACFAVVALATSLLAFAFVVRDIFHEGSSDEHVASDLASTSHWFLAKSPDHVKRTQSIAQEYVARTRSLARARIARTPSLARGHVTGPVENVSAAETANRSTVLLERVDWRKQAEDLREQIEGAGHLREQAIHWRRVAGELSCQLEGPDGTSPSGGWCLRPSEEDWGNLGRAAVHHVVADDGLARTIVKFLVPNETERVTLVDVCAGVGQYGFWFRAHNATIDWRGFDGAENIESFTGGAVKWIDVTDPLFDSIDQHPDWVMSLECGEHIPPEATDAFIDLLDRHNRKGVILSWAVIGQPGHSHINTRSNEDVVARFLERGYYQDQWTGDFQREGRESANYYWFKDTFMVFRKVGSDHLSGAR